MPLGIPTLDLRTLEEDTAPLARACQEWGFFKLSGHGISQARRERFMHALQAFFAAPSATKASIERTRENPRGFFDRELTKNKQDWKEIFDFGVDQDAAGDMNQWPEGIANFKLTMVDWFEASYELSLVLMERILTTLGAAPYALQDAFFPSHSSFLRLNYYPVCDEPADPAADIPTTGHLGVSHHTDAGALTVLLQDNVPGLQVKRGATWYTVEPEPGAFIVNVGDLLQVWSNNRYRAPLHRVLANSSKARFSAPFFLNPRFDCTVAPLTKEPANYRPLHWGAYRAGRAAGDYANVGKEVQVADYAL
jgi:isopenicillin N synthase-like dioxygenase